jgi:hypothetical protein
VAGSKLVAYFKDLYGADYEEAAGLSISTIVLPMVAS